MEDCINCKNYEEHIDVFVKIIDYIAQDNQRLRDQNTKLQESINELEQLKNMIKSDLKLIQSGSV